MGEIRVWVRTSAPALASILALAGCGGSDDPSPSTDDAGTDLRSPDAYECVVPPETIAEVTGFTFTSIEPDGGGIGGSSGSLTWQGCEYETDGNATVELSVIVDDEGEPDVASYDAFVAGVPADESAAELADGSFVDRLDQVWVKTDDATVSFSLRSTRDGSDPPPVDDLVAIAAGVLQARGGEKDCGKLPGQVPLRYPASSSITTGTFDNGTGDFTTCLFEVLIDREKWLLEVGHRDDPAVFDQLRAERDDADVGGPVLVEGVGDSAVHLRDALYFKDGGTAYALSGEDDRNQPLEPEVLQAIAAAVVAAG